MVEKFGLDVDDGIALGQKCIAMTLVVAERGPHVALGLGVFLTSPSGTHGDALVVGSCCHVDVQNL